MSCLLYTSENGQDRVSLIPGQQARCGMKNIEVCEVDTREYISWKNGMFIFNEMTLENIMVQMQRWYCLLYTSPGLCGYGLHTPDLCLIRKEASDNPVLPLSLIHI